MNSSFFFVSCKCFFLVCHRYELEFVRKSRYFYGFTASLTLSGHFLILIAILLAYVISGQIFRAREVYICVASLNMLRRTFFTYVLRAFQTSGELNTTLDRIKVK